MQEVINFQTDSNCISVEELRQYIASNRRLTIIDVRTEGEFELLHIPGAVHIHEAMLETAAKEFTPLTLYVTVCGKGGGRSSNAAEILRRMNLEAAALCGGTLGWFAETK